ncbi:Cyclopropane-fatty-acyl-phospholipid synthase [Segniliparus rotundus DSM 44985]|uniref:Cyclopropane-fatty-acyl-phospholipid synthase n=1 Tax=Segniliparus rotundus (strain ATCC BAA-972 / CDC 1076 / CIP 108378 / DSM 44985 / JCM 13578) TaxID=640132 RepID=D6Z9I5_SEGRD|nr:class I SAM-dependent methyltransferase [Segniliparus rotundus]ADG96512.1 Cyclopropane-fatty-acyl-phospholipid synthase [Segniliparus rotundus DSM 44985]
MSPNPVLTQPPGLLVDAQRWPDVASVPKGPVAAIGSKVALRLLCQAAERFSVRLARPDGTALGTGRVAAGAPVIVVRQPDRLGRRLARHGLIGFGESYMAGEWDSPDLVAALTALAAGMAHLVPRRLQRLRPLVLARQPKAQRNSLSQAQRNIAQHYDLSNELFAAFLDETMVYSSALFEQLPATQDELPEAQRRKVDRLLDLAGVRAGSRVLEIGTGWGELCLRAAQRGATVRSVTLSCEQRELALDRVRRAGFADQVAVDLCDYRSVDGQYDCVVSVEMVEAVGREYWPTYFRALDRLVVPGGRVAIQAITMPHDRMLASRRTHTWVQKYIFPGGLLPSTEAISDVTARHTALRTVERTSLRPHYAQTLQLWRERFLASGDRVAALGFDHVFQRMWELYLAYSEAGFRSGYLDVQQWVFIREGARR